MEEAVCLILFLFILRCKNGNCRVKISLTDHKVLQLYVCACVMWEASDSFGQTQSRGPKQEASHTSVWSMCVPVSHKHPSFLSDYFELCQQFQSEHFCGAAGSECYVLRLPHWIASIWTGSESSAYFQPHAADVESLCTSFRLLFPLMNYSCRLNIWPKHGASMRRRHRPTVPLCVTTSPIVWQWKQSFILNHTFPQLPCQHRAQ